MSDLIDRQKALEHIEKTRQAAYMMDDIREASRIMRSMDLLEKVVMKQPSVQLDNDMIHLKKEVWEDERPEPYEDVTK